MPKRKAYLEITNRCNLSCSFCPGCKRPPHSLTMEEFEHLAAKLRPFADFLYYHLLGEPTAHPLLPKFLAHAKGLGFASVITTNGTLLHKCGDRILEEASLPHKVSISLHAFEANDIPIPFDTYLDHCIAFAQKAAARGVYIALRLWNLDGRAQGALHEKNDLVLKKLHSVFGDFEQTRSGYRLSDRIFLEWGEKFDWPSLSMPEMHESGCCYGLRDQIGVLCDGTVVPCCLDAEGDMPLGNLFTEELDTILSSPRAKAIYDGFTAHRCQEALCRRCMRATYYRKEDPTSSKN